MTRISTDWPPIPKSLNHIDFLAIHYSNKQSQSLIIHTIQPDYSLCSLQAITIVMSTNRRIPAELKFWPSIKRCTTTNITIRLFSNHAIPVEDCKWQAMPGDQRWPSLIQPHGSDHSSKLRQVLEITSEEGCLRSVRTWMCLSMPWWKMIWWMVQIVKYRITHLHNYYIIIYNLKSLFVCLF